MVRLFLLTTLSVTFWSLVTLRAPDAAVAQIRFNSPSIGAPGNREAGASRSAVCTTSDRGLTALVPDSNIGLTTEARPTFFAYIPPTSARTAEFLLYEEDSNALIYRTSLPIAGESGVVSIQLPDDSTVPLKVEQSYYWYFTVICDERDRSADITVQGGVRRVAIDPEVDRQLQAAPIQNRPGIYAEAGIWQEALSTLADLNRTHPSDPTVNQEWTTLLGAVGLESVANEPLLNSPL